MMRILGILLISLLLGACGKKGADQAAPSEKPGKGKDRKPSIAAYVTKPLSVQQTMLGIGTILPAEQVEIKTEMAGRIETIDFKEGQSVAMGVRLLKLQDEELQANRAKALVRRDFLQGSVTRKQKQFEMDAISKQDFELSESELAGAEADLRLWDAQLAKTEIKAPFAGVLGFRNVSPGAVLSAGSIVTTLIKKYPVKVEFSVSADMATFSKVGTLVEIALGTGKSGMGRIFATEGSFDASNRTMKVRATVEKGEDLIPGAAIEVRIPGDLQKGFFVPPDALTGNVQGPVVLVLRSGKVKEIPVAIGSRMAGSVQILQGLSEGDTVLCVGAQSVRPGMSVTIAEFRE
jgi:membrane fusion protein (multidrug efflux system)